MWKYHFLHVWGMTIEIITHVFFNAVNICPDLNDSVLISSCNKITHVSQNYWYHWSCMRLRYNRKVCLPWWPEASWQVFWLVHQSVTLWIKNKKLPLICWYNNFPVIFWKINCNRKSIGQLTCLLNLILAIIILKDVYVSINTSSNQILCIFWELYINNNLISALMTSIYCIFPILPHKDPSIFCASCNNKASIL